MDVEIVVPAESTIKITKYEKPANEISYDSILVHLKCMGIAPSKEYHKVISRIVLSIPSTMQLLKNFDFSSVFEYVDDNGISNLVDNTMDGTNFMHLPRSILKKPLAESYAKILPDCTAYLQLLVLVYCHRNCDDKTLCITNANYMLGAVELYQPVIASPLRAKIIFYINLIFEKWNTVDKNLIGFLFRHLRYSYSSGDSACTAQMLNLICRFYIRRKDLKPLREFISTNMAFEVSCCFQHVTFYDPEKTYQYARYMHYCGFLYMIICQYNRAYKCLCEALRAAPMKSAAGFKSMTTKYLIIVELLRGNSILPEYYKYLKDGATAYALLNKAVSYGQVDTFHEFTNLFKDIYKHDRLTHMIDRINTAVLNQAIQTILNSYSSITIKQIATKLNIENDEDAQNLISAYICVNKLKETQIDLSSGVVYNSSHLADYGTPKAFVELHKRILLSSEYCDMCHKKMVYDTKDYYNKLAHDQDDELFIDEDDNNDGNNMIWLGNNNNHNGPDAGI